MSSLSNINETLGEIDDQINDIFRALSNGFQKLEKMKDSSRQSRQLDDLTEKMRQCKGLIKEFDKEVKVGERMYSIDTNRMLSDKKQAMIKELNSYVNMKKQVASSLDNNRADLFDGPGNGENYGEENVRLVSSMANQELIDTGNRMMDETDQSIERSKQIVEETMKVGADTSSALKAQTEQMNHIINELDSVRFSLKKANQVVKEIGRQIATDKCIMAMLFLIVIGVLAIIIVKLINPNNEDIRDIPGLAPPAQTRKLLWDLKNMDLKNM